MDEFAQAFEIIMSVGVTLPLAAEAAFAIQDLFSKQRLTHVERAPRVVAKVAKRVVASKAMRRPQLA